MLICSKRNRAFYFMCQCGQRVGRGKEMEEENAECFAHCNLQDILAAHLCF